MDKIKHYGFELDLLALQAHEDAKITVDTLHELRQRHVTSDMLIAVIPAEYRIETESGLLFQDPAEESEEADRFFRNYLLAPYLQRIELEELLGNNEAAILHEIYGDISHIDPLDIVRLNQGDFGSLGMGIRVQGINIDDLVLPKSAG